MPEPAEASALLEADSLGDRVELVRRAVMAKYMPSPDPMAMEAPLSIEDYCEIEDVFDDYVIVEKGDKTYFRLDYAVASDGTVTLGDPQKVVKNETYSPVTEGSTRPTSAAVQDADPAQAGAPRESSPIVLREGAQIIEAVQGSRGREWRVLLIQAGTSKNGTHYAPKVLREAASLYQNAPAYADHSEDDASTYAGRSVKDKVGIFRDPRFEQVSVGGKLTEGVTAKFRVYAGWLRDVLSESVADGSADFIGLSHNVSAEAPNAVIEGRNVRNVTRIHKVHSVDVVDQPSAGGRVMSMLESERNTQGDTTVVVDATQVGAGPPFDPDAFKSSLLDEVKAILTEALKPAQSPAGSGPTETVQTPAAEAPLSEREQRIIEASNRIEIADRKASIREKVEAAGLPKAHSAKLLVRLTEAAERRDISAEVDQEITWVRELIAESGPATPSWDGKITLGDGQHDKLRKALEGWFKGTPVDGVPAVRDLRESYAGWTGQHYMDVDPYIMFQEFGSRYDAGRDHKRVTEALTVASWGQVFGDVMYNRLIDHYVDSPDYDKWRLIVSDIENVPDFRTRHFTRIGGYGDFASVAEGATYPAVTSPTDEEVTYSLGKYGGIDSLTMEMVLGDKLGLVRRLPQYMAYAAARTLYKAVFDLATTTNPTMDYDSVALYNAAHGNTGTTALSVAGLDAVNVAMRSQTAYNQSAEILGSRNKPNLIIVPNELESLTQRVVNPSDAFLAAIASSIGASTEIDPQRFKGQGIGYHVYDQLTDATDWFAVADPKLVPTMVVGFLQGKQTPELFMADQQNVGSTFTSDQYAIKLRFVFGMDILEHRSFNREVVSGS